MNKLTSPMSGAVPAHIQKLFAQTAANDALAAGVSAGYPIISYKGKVWHIVEGGERTLITIGEGRNANDPAASLEAVIIMANDKLNKVYYPDGYEEGSTERPTCYSDDGITPSRDSPEIQSKTCGACRHNEWGSKISDTGSRGKACADSRRMAIAAPNDLENPMLLRCPAASLKTLLAYGQQLSKRGWPYYAMVTRIGFDSSLAYPSLTFTPERWLDEDEVAEVVKMREDDLVLTITAMHPTTLPDHAPPTPEAKPEEDAFARMERLAAGVTEVKTEEAVATEAQPSAEPPKTRARRAKATATAEEVAAVVQAAQPQAEPPKTRGFGKPAAVAPVAQAAPPPAPEPEEDEDTGLGDAALSELENVLSGFDDEDEG